MTVNINMAADSLKKPLLLLILDGWGHREAAADNAISQASTPVWDRLWRDSPHTLIHTSGQAVGLPDGQMGNSEVGHMNLGAGRVVYQDFTRIERAIGSADFFANPVLCSALDKTAQAGKAVHLLGLLSPGGVHSHENHIHACARLAVERGIKRLYLHAFLDGRDTPPRSARASLEAMERVFAELGYGRVASLVGRYFAMDRDQRWDRVEKAYQLLAEGRAEHCSDNPISALEAAYQRGESDEFVTATSILPSVCIEPGDTVIFCNFRADRARELTRAFVEPEFTGFTRGKQPELTAFVCMTEYQQNIPAQIAFPPVPLDASFGEIIAQRGLTQLRIAETEKYAHVTFFFNGGREAVFAGEKRLLIDSPKVATYDLQPEMSAGELTDRLVEQIESRELDVIICNIANPDMVGHTGNFTAALKAVATVDRCLGRIIHAIQSVNGEMLITADHGNIEMMMDPDTGQAHTAHTTAPVPLVYVGEKNVNFTAGGALCDIAPTMLALLQIPQPEQMSGRSLLCSAEQATAGVAHSDTPLATSR